MTKKLLQSLPRITELVSQGFSPQQIYKLIGGRKTELLKVVREIQREKEIPYLVREKEKYIPRKYIFKEWIVLSLHTHTTTVDKNDISTKVNKFYKGILNYGKDEIINKLKISITESDKRKRYFEVKYTKCENEFDCTGSIELESRETSFINAKFFQVTRIKEIAGYLQAVASVTGEANFEEMLLQSSVAIKNQQYKNFAKFLT